MDCDRSRDRGSASLKVSGSIGPGRGPRRQLCSAWASSFVGAGRWRVAAEFWPTSLGSDAGVFGGVHASFSSSIDLFDTPEWSPSGAEELPNSVGLDLTWPKEWRRIYNHPRPMYRTVPGRTRGMTTEQQPHWLAERPALERLGYQMLGNYHDAQDLVQDCFERALESPPPDRTSSWQPWLRKVLVHLAIDRLRQRKRRSYVGPWLPGMIDTQQVLSGDLALRLQHSQQISFALLHALEQLSAKQRAVYVLRQLMEQSGREVAQLLYISEADVRSSLSRARKQLRKNPPQLDEALYQAHGQLLNQLSEYVHQGNVEAVLGLLAADAQCHSDAGGQHVAALRTISGAQRVAKFLVGAARRTPAPTGCIVRECNGLPVLELLYPEGESRFAPRTLVALDLAELPSREICQIYTLSAREKLPRRLSGP